jgi:hypothetical protein
MPHRRDEPASAWPARAAVLVERYLAAVRDHEPVEATRLGVRERDGDLPDLAPAALEARSRDLGALAAEVDVALAAIPPGGEPRVREARGDLRLLAEHVAYRRFLLDTRPRHRLDPLYALEIVASGLHELLRRRDVDRGERVRRLAAAVQRARRVPVLLEQAGSLLDGSPAPHLDVALQRLSGVLALVREELPRQAEALQVDVSPARDAGDVAAEGLEAFGALLVELSDEPATDWRLGPAHHAVTLRAALGTSMAPGEIEDRARGWIAEVRAEMAELTGAGWSRRFPGEPVPADADERIRRSLTAVAATAVHRDRLVAEARQAITEARAFAVDSGLVDVPPADRLTVEEVPPFLRGVAVAFITSPPPLDPAAGCTYYLAPVPPSWTDEQARSFLREYNPAQLRSLAIHEGYPGHFVQLEHAAQHPRLARRLFTRPAFAEGWAVYIERVVAAAGFGDGDSSAVGGDDYRLTQRKLELRIAVNALLDVGLHAGELADDDAIALLTGTACQEPAEAEGKLVRAKVTSGQLCAYFVGGEEVTDLRADVHRREGRDFDVRRFHQRLLSHGTPTVALLAEALQDDSPSRRPFARSA